MAIDWNALRLPKGDSRFVSKAARRREAVKNGREVFAQVDQRDEFKCRVCKRYTNPEAITLLERGHRHHVNYKSLGGMDTSDNICNLCARCHSAIHNCEIRISGNADQRDPLTGKLNGLRLEKRTESGWTTERWI